MVKLPRDATTPALFIMAGGGTGSAVFDAANGKTELALLNFVIASLALSYSQYRRRIARTLAAIGQTLEGVGVHIASSATPVCAGRCSRPGCEADPVERIVPLTPSGRPSGLYDYCAPHGAEVRRSSPTRYANGYATYRWEPILPTGARDG